MSDEYTPTTAEVLTAALAGGIYSEAAFDRWLDARELRASVRALMDVSSHAVPMVVEETGASMPGLPADTIIGFAVGMVFKEDEEAQR